MIDEQDLIELQTILTRLDELEQGSGVFSSVIRTCHFQLGWTDETAAKILDTSQPNYRRWFQGKVVPPAWKLVVRFMREEVQAKLKILQEPT